MIIEIRVSISSSHAVSDVSVNSLWTTSGKTASAYRRVHCRCGLGHDPAKAPRVLGGPGFGLRDEAYSVSTMGDPLHGAARRTIQLCFFCCDQLRLHFHGEDLGSPGTKL